MYSERTGSRSRVKQRHQGPSEAAVFASASHGDVFDVSVWGTSVKTA